MKLYSEDIKILGILLICVLLIVVAIWANIANEKQWSTFSIEHHCKKVGKINSSVQTGFGFGVLANGQTGTIVTTSVTPSKIGWLCDDGITYWRE